VGAHEFRNHFGYYLERAADGHEVLVSRRGRPYVRLLPVEPRLRLVAASGNTKRDYRTNVQSSGGLRSPTSDVCLPPRDQSADAVA
jgi:prevent-host-death family protein